MCNAGEMRVLPRSLGHQPLPRICEVNYKVYASDEGYGPLVRQQAICRALQLAISDLRVTIQTSRLAHVIKWILPEARLIDRFNNISWAKKADGAPDHNKIRAFFSDYIHRSNQFMSTEQDLSEFSFIISDFCFEAFPLAARAGVPAFGVAHFTWDWFFSKLFPVPISTDVLQRWRTFALAADALYFPPFTPSDILEAYRGKAVEVPFIVSERRNLLTCRRQGRINVLIIDSGSGVLASSIRRAIERASELTGFHFFLSESFQQEGDNISFVPSDELFVDYIPSMDLVISRGGFNTVSECVGYRVPMLLLGEALNPEMESNMVCLKQEGLGSFVSLRSFSERLPQTLESFMGNEYEIIKRNMEEHNYPHNGAEIIAADILNRLDSRSK